MMRSDGMHDAQAALAKQQRELQQFEELLRYTFVEIDRLGFFSLAELLRRKMETFTLAAQPRKVTMTFVDPKNG